jgi:hypothetical protein
MEAMWNAADAEGRDLTAAERSQMEELVEATKSMHSLEQQMKVLGGDAPSFVTRTDPNWSNTAGGPGDVFVKSQGYQKIADARFRGQTWSSGPVEVSSIQLVKGTMLETGAGGPGGGPVPPLYQPGIVDKLFEPLGVRDVFGQSTTTASQVRYVVEGTGFRGLPGWRRRARSPSPPSPCPRSSSRSRRSPRRSRSPTSSSRTRRASRAT